MVLRAWLMVALGAVLLLGGCPNGCNWPTDECQTFQDCAAGELCVWSGNNGVGGYNYCLVECAVEQDEPCGRMECEDGRRWADTGAPCLSPGDDPTWETFDASGTLVATGAYAPAALGVNEDSQCACPAAIKDGNWRTWDADGQPLTEENYRVGARHGPQRTWYPNGQLATERHYENGQSHGTFQGWYQNGQVEYVGQYERNYGEGAWYYYYSDGALRGEVVYQHGSVVEASYWDEQGNPVDTMPPRSEE